MSHLGGVVRKLVQFKCITEKDQGFRFQPTETVWVWEQSRYPFDNFPNFLTINSNFSAIGITFRILLDSIKKS